MGDEINFPKNMIIKIFRESVQTQVGVINNVLIAW